MSEHHTFTVKSKSPPVVELDMENRAAYIRFNNSPVHRTSAAHTEKMHLAIDLSKSGEVVGIEVIGFTELRLNAVLKTAKVKTPPQMDLSKARFRPVACHV
jgi:uncharacterized protein YuzE